MQTIAELYDLSGKGALVTGGGTGIGQAISMRLAEAGAAVMIADINPESANQTVDLIKTNGGKAQAIQADACKAEDAVKTSRATEEAFGSLDIIVNNAGIYPMSPLFETTEDLLDKVLCLNLKGPFLFSQAAAQVMIDAGKGGKIINLASTDGIRPTDAMIHYSASKGGVIMLTKALALELAPHGIRVNAVAPGGIITPGTMDTQDVLLKITGKSLEELTEKFFSRMPFGRMGEPDEVAKVVLFLASASSDYMTGEVLVVDGGFLLS